MNGGNEIFIVQDIVDLIPEVFPKKRTLLSGLGTRFRAQFEKSSEVEDLGNSIVYLQHAIDVCPDEDIGKARLFNTVGGNLFGPIQIIWGS